MKKRTSKKTKKVYKSKKWQFVNEILEALHRQERKNIALRFEVTRGNVRQFINANKNVIGDIKKLTVRQMKTYARGMAKAAQLLQEGQVRELRNLSVSLKEDGIEVETPYLKDIRKMNGKELHDFIAQLSDAGYRDEGISAIGY